MADRNVPMLGDVPRKLKDMGDGSFAEVVSAALVRVDGSAIGGAGIVASASFTPAAAAYGAADIVDVAKQFSWTYADSGLAIPTGSLIRVTAAIMKIDATAVISGETSYTLHNYSVTPPSAQADNAAWTLASADLPSYLGSFSLGTPADLGAALYIKTTGLTEEIKLADGVTSHYGELVTVGAFTAAAVARQVLLRGFVL